MPQPLVYVVILNWNLKQDTAECVESVLQSRYESCRVVVVDNGSSDGSPEHLARRFASIELLANSSNLGFAAGNNVGIRHALDRNADHVFVLNNDTTVDPDMLGRLVACAQGDGRIGIVAPKILYYQQRDRIWRLGDRIHPYLPVPLSVGRDQVDQGQFSEPFDVDYVTLCGALIKSSVLRSVGLLDERFFFTYEDADFCQRSRGAGYRIVCEPRALMWHKVSLSARKDRAHVAYLKSKSRAVFYRRHPHGPHRWLTAAYLWLNTLGTAAVTALRGEMALAGLMVRGLYDGYREELRVS
jgi:GT2 family glycosyltransferase